MAKQLNPPQTRSTSELESQGWQAWYGFVFGQDFVVALAPHHRQAIEWHWEARMALRRNEKPDYNAYFPIWSREHMKSTVARRMVVCDACLSVSEANPNERGGYCLYVSRNKSMVLKHALSIEALITSPKVRSLYPALSEVKRNVQGSSKGWQATFLNTKADFVFHFSGMDEGLAGGNMEDWRVTMMCLDDIDSREDSPVISENRFNTLTTEILPMAQDGTLVFFAQNLISRYSSMYRIQKGHARVLTDRKPTQPVPAVLNLITEPKTVDGIVKDIIISGEPTWHLFPIEKCQDRMNREGKPAFMRERQHDVDQDKEGLVLTNWNDKVHVISKSQFASVYGTREKPQRWNGYGGNDWSRTKTKHHANVAGVLTVASQNSPLPGTIFLVNPMSFPANSAPEDVAVRLLSAISPNVRHNGFTYTWKELVKITLQKTDLQHLIHDTTKLIEARRGVLAKVIPTLVKPILRAQNYRMFRGSHEQNRTGALAVYQNIFGLPFIPTNPGADGGVDSINFVTRVDYDQDHPFKRGEKGLTGFHVVVEDDMSQEPIVINGVKVYPPVSYNESLTPDDLHDGDLFRYQAKNCRFRDPFLTVAGEKDGDILKMNDDWINFLMFFFYDDALRAAPLDDEEKAEAVLNVRAPELSLTVIEASEDRNIQGAMAARENALNRIRRDVSKSKWTSAFDRANAERNRR